MWAPELSRKVQWRDDWLFPSKIKAAKTAGSFNEFLIMRSHQQVWAASKGHHAAFR
jgi:hypothetical protein